MLIPRGKPILARHDANGGYTSISVEISSGIGDYISTYMYEVDNILKRLNGDGTLDSWYSLIYFHIATSSHLPDPLLSCTGLYKAIDMLRSAFSFAFRTIDSPLEDRLKAISTLAPVRTYYPNHLEVMESVKWNDKLSPLSQSDLLVDMIQDILQHGNLQRLFFLDQAKCSFEYGDKALKERALFRDARWLCTEYYQTVPDLGMFLVIHVFFTFVYLWPEYDRIYVPDRCLLTESSSHSECAIAEITRYVQQWCPRTKLPTGIWSILDNWSPFIIGEEIPHRPQQWLLSPGSTLWFPLLTRCLKATKENDTHELSFLLAILSYRDDIENTLVNGLLAVACCDLLCSTFKEAQSELLHIPPGHSFCRIMDLDLTRMELEGIVRPELLPYKCTSYYCQSDTDEERQSHVNMYEAASTDAVNHFASHLLAQWESGQEPTQPNLSLSVIAHGALIQLMKTVTACCIRKRANRRLHNYAKALDATFSRVRLDNSTVAMALASHSSAIIQPGRKYMP
ncbi:MAG TPA: hypothetical protein VGO47_04080, partial [Chlamydiales bacterium]|nr:hypothetical protein [Chlamydiales bacterium]